MKISYSISPLSIHIISQLIIMIFSNQFNLFFEKIKEIPNFIDRHPNINYIIKLLLIIFTVISIVWALYVQKTTYQNSKKYSANQHITHNITNNHHTILNDNNVSQSILVNLKKMYDDNPDETAMENFIPYALILEKEGNSKDQNIELVVKLLEEAKLLTYQSDFTTYKKFYSICVFILNKKYMELISNKLVSSASMMKLYL